MAISNFGLLFNPHTGLLGTEMEVPPPAAQSGRSSLMKRSVDLDAHFQSFRDADAQSAFDVWLRRGLVAAASLVLVVTLKDRIFLYWALGYAALDIIYTYVLTSQKGAVSRLRLTLAASLSFVTGSWVAAMAIYFAFADAGSLYFVGACIVVGQALHCFSSHWSLRLALMIDLIIVAIGTLGVTVAMAYHVTPDGMAFTIFGVGLTVLIYFVHSLRKVILDRTALRRRAEAELQDQKMKALGQFTSGVAHDFNNMLTVILGNIELARLQSLPPNAEELLDEAEAASRNVAALVKQLLAYGRKSDLSFELWDINTLLERVERVSGRLLPRSITFTFQRAPENTMVRVDGAMLETAVLNLIINARDALGATNGAITLSAQPDIETGKMQITVSDTGPGMEADVLRQATNPFFTTKPKGQGSGLGLAMVIGFCEQSGGALDLSNLRPKGLGARISLPLDPHRD